MALSYKENMLLAYNHQEPEYMPLIDDCDLLTPGGLDFINEAPHVPGENKDWFGQQWTFEETIKAPNPTPGFYLMEDITEWEDVYHFPNFSKLDWEGHAARDTANWDREHKLSRITDGYGMWERMFSTMPFDEALCALITEPEACYDFFGAIADHKIRLHEYIFKYYKPDILVMHDDYGGGSGMFMSPEVWRELLKPHLQRIIDHTIAHGVMYEHHCCGYFAPILPEIADMGAVAFNTAHVSNKPAELKKQIGYKMCFVGGFDTQYLDSVGTTEEQLRQHVRDTIDAMAPGGSWVPRCQLVNADRKAIAAKEIAEYGSNFYSRPRP